MQFTNMFLDTIPHFWKDFSKNINSLQSWRKPLRQNRKSIFQHKENKPVTIQINFAREVFGFQQKHHPNSPLI